ncbi:MAG TPA: hypothetical protein VGM30_24900 [Puia sp.]|jgi:hypothetical protein
MKAHSSISHFTAKEQNALHNIKNRIVDHVGPLIIYCFGSKARIYTQRSCFTTKKTKEEWDFSCDLLIIVPDDTIIGANTFKEVYQSTAPFGEVNVIIHPLDFVINHLKEGNLFFSWVHRSAIILYEKSNAIRLLPHRIASRIEYQQQAERFYLDKAIAINYLEVKLLPVGQALQNHLHGISDEDEGV